MIFWEFFYLYKNVSLKMGKIFPKYYIAYLELCNSFDNGCLFFRISNHAVLLGRPVGIGAGIVGTSYKPSLVK